MYAGLTVRARLIIAVTSVGYAVWVAWARGPNGEHQQGGGDSPEQALADLANKLKPIQGNPNG